MTASETPITVQIDDYGRILRYRIDPREFATPRVIAQLAAAWQELCQEVPSVAKELCQGIRSLGRQLACQPIEVGARSTFGLGDLRTRHLNAWEADLLAKQSQVRTDTQYRYAVYVLALLRRIEDDQPGTLEAGVVTRLRQSTRLPHIRRTGDPDHSDHEVRRIRSAAHRIVHQELEFHDQARRDAKPLPIPGTDVMVALNVLLSLATGEPPEVLRAIKIDNIIATPIPEHNVTRDQARGWENLCNLAKSDAVQSYAVTLTKKRAGIRYDEVYDRKRNRAAHRALTAILVLTAHARTLTTEQSLWLTGTEAAIHQMPWNTTYGNLGKWYGNHVLGPEIEAPHKYSRLRKVVLRRELIKNPTRYLRDGRRHSTRTLFNHYTNSATLKAVAGRLVVEAITEYYEAAIGPTVITPGAEELIRAGETVEVLDPGTAHLLIGGELDGALAACRNPEDSPFAPAGEICPVAQTGQCFTCPNAIITQDNLPALILLDELSDPKNAANALIWRQVWGDIHKSTRRILPLFPATARQEAAQRTGAVPVDLGLRNDQRGNHD